MNNDNSKARSSADPAQAASLAELGIEPPRPRWRRRSTWIVAALAVAAVTGIAAWLAADDRAAAPTYATHAVQRGDLALTVVANGSLQPTRTVAIGSELSGTVARVLVDVNDHVAKGQVLVELDTAKLRDQVTRSTAALAQARANLANAGATVQESRAALSRLQEVARLSGGQVPSKAELDTAEATLQRAHAAEAGARASVAEAQAALSTDTTNLGKASIRSPIDGVVLTRSVDPGNAVAASLQAVTLFTIAEDLTRLKLQVNVDEADVAGVQPGQGAEFTVSAWAGRRFPATITRVAYGSTTTDNVVSYVAQLDVANADNALRPGMTATATIRTADRRGVLLVPNTALRFTPAAGPQAAPQQPGGSPLARLMPRPPGAGAPRRPAGDAAAARRGAPSDAEARRQVYVLRDGQPVAMPVQVGLSDGRMTEVTGGELREGMEVITEQRAAPRR